MIRDFIAKHADADVTLRDWYKRTTKANWTNFAEEEHYPIAAPTLVETIKPSRRHPSM